MAWLSVAEGSDKSVGMATGVACTDSAGCCEALFSLAQLELLWPIIFMHTPIMRAQGSTESSTTPTPVAANELKLPDETSAMAAPSAIPIQNRYRMMRRPRREDCAQRGVLFITNVFIVFSIYRVGCVATTRVAVSKDACLTKVASSRLRIKFDSSSCESIWMERWPGVCLKRSKKLAGQTRCRGLKEILKTTGSVPLPVFSGPG